MATPNLLQPESQAFLDDLFAYMQNPLLSLEGIIERFDKFTDDERQFIYDDPHGYSNLAILAHFAVCNPSVTLEIIQHLCEMHPNGAVDVIRRYSQRGRTIFHYACISPSCPFSIIEYIISLYPDGLGKSSKGMGLPLHCFVNRAKFLPEDPKIYDLDVNNLASLVRSYPQALTCRDYENQQLLPIDVACKRSDISSEIVRVLIDFPECTVCRIDETNRNYQIKKNHALEILLDSRSGAEEHSFDDDKYLEAASVLINHTPENQLVNVFEIACKHKSVSKQLLQLFLNRSPPLPQQMLTVRWAQGSPLHALCDNRDCPLDAIQLIHDSYPAAATTRDGRNQLPVFYAASKHNLEVFEYAVAPLSRFSLVDFRDKYLPESCEHGTVDVVKYILSLFPDLLSQPNCRGDLPLHEALKSKSDDQLEKVEYLMERYPEAASIPGENKQLPLHRICAKNANDVIVILLLKANPSAVSERDDNGRLPIHLLSCTVSHDLAIIRRLHALYPDGLMEPDNDGLLPLHLHVSERYFNSLELLKFLVCAGPEALKVQSQAHGLPIHCACKEKKFNSGSETVKFLVQCYPESINIYNENVGLPLHCAKDELCFSYLLHLRYPNLSKEPNPKYLHSLLRDENLQRKLMCVDKFLSFFPRQSKILSRFQDSDGFPLHIAVQGKNPRADIPVIRNLLELNPEAARTQDSMGYLPIHWGASGNIFEVVSLLVNKNLQGLMVADNVGNLPIHLACRYGASFQVIDLLVSQAPQCVDVPNNDGCTPLAIACENNSNGSIAGRLLRNSQRALRMACRKGDLPFHKACFFGNLPIVKLLVEIDEAPCTFHPGSSRMLPFLLLCQTEGKDNDGLFDTAEFIGLAWTVLKAHPDVVKTTSDLLPEGDISGDENIPPQDKMSSS